MLKAICSKMEVICYKGRYRAARAAKKSNKCDCLVSFKVFMKRIHSDYTKNSLVGTFFIVFK